MVKIQSKKSKQAKQAGVINKFHNQAIKMKTVVDWIVTTIPENIQHYLEHRNISADAVINIQKDGGHFYVFYKKVIFEDLED